jgi:hypothetical protein
LGLFFIGLNFVSAGQIVATPAWRDQLRSTLASMSAESLEYKGVQHCAGQVLGSLG